MSRAGTPEEQLRARLEDLARAGIDGLSRRGPRAVAEERPVVPAASAGGRDAKARVPAAPRRSVAVPQEALGQAERVDERAASAREAVTLDAMKALLQDCRLCKLCERRTQVVFGVGNPRARLMFVGEGPGRDEDLRGEPFVGRAGQLLTEMVEKGMRIPRPDVYIANVVKCRPPENRDPEPDEVAACEGFLKRQVALVQPAVIVALGRFAVQCLLRTTTPIGKLRGAWHEYAGIPLMPTFHPAYLLRNPADKRLAWEDLKLVLARLASP